MTRVGWTGHRPHFFADPEAARRAVFRLARDLVEEDDALVFLCGGQRGVDTWAALAAVDLGVPFVLYLPLPPGRFTEGWDPEDVAVLERLRRAASREEIVDPTGRLGEEAYRSRNEAIARHCDLLVAVWAGFNAGGTYDTICRARAHGRPIRSIQLAPSGAPWRAGERGL
ncbi:MAG TPA: hypothetical protein VIN09_05920 [Chloroflexota bacterium]